MTFREFVAALVAEAEQVGALDMAEYLPGDQEPRVWLDGLMGVIAAGRGPLARMARDLVAAAGAVHSD